MSRESIQSEREDLFAGECDDFNEKLCELDVFEKYFNSFTKGKKKPRHRFLYESLNLKRALIQFISCFLSNASYDPNSKIRRVRSVNLTLELAQRFRRLNKSGFFQTKAIESSFESFFFAHSLIHLFLHLGLIEKKDENENRSDVFDILLEDETKINQQNRYQLNAQIESFISNYMVGNIQLGLLPSPIKTQMLAPPKMHKLQTEILEGGYYNSIFSNSVSNELSSSIISNKNIKMNQFDLNRSPSLKFTEDSKAISTVNYLQKTGWVYNEGLLQALQNIKFPSDEESQNNGKNLRDSLTLEHALNHQKILAKSKSNEFFYPWFFDYRGRLYCSTIQLNPQGDDLSKALLLFSEIEKSPCKDTLIEYAKSKFVVQEKNKITTNSLRDALFNSNLTQYISSKKTAKIDFPSFKKEFISFLTNIGTSNVAAERLFLKERYTVLALILEFHHFFKKSEWRLPIQLDATCNGQQHMAAIVKNSNIAELTKLISSDRDLDLYEFIAAKTCAIFSKEKQWLQSHLRVLEENVNRHSMKTPIMTKGYGKKYLALDLIKNPKFFPIELWDDFIISKQELAKAETEFQLPKKVQPREKYFFAPLWFVNDRNKKKKQHEIFKQRGYYTLGEYENIFPVKIEKKKLEEHIISKFKSPILTNESLDAHKQQILEEHAKENIRKELIKSLAKSLESVCNDELDVLLLQNLIKDLHNKSLEKSPQVLEDSSTWFSFESNICGKKIHFVRLKSAKSIDKPPQAKKMSKAGVAQIRRYPLIDSQKLENDRTVNVKLFREEILQKSSMQTKLLPSFVHGLDSTHLYLIVDKWNSEGLGSITATHDSFGMLPKNVQRFREIARETFIQLHKGEPLRQFYKQCGVEIPLHYPNNPDFDLHKVGLNMFNF